MTASGIERSVTKIKLDGVARTHTSLQIDVTPERAWMFAPEGTAVHDDTGELFTRHDTAGIQLLEPGQWWTAWWFDDRRWIAIDVTFPVEETPIGFRYTDLELDLWWRDGDSGIVDQEELQAALASGQIDEMVATTAEQVASALHDRLRHDHEFVQRGFAMLDHALGHQPRSE